MCFKKMSRPQLERRYKKIWAIDRPIWHLVHGLEKIAYNDGRDGCRNWEAYSAGPVVLAVGRSNLPGVPVPWAMGYRYEMICRAFLRNRPYNPRKYEKFRDKIAARFVRELERRTA